MQEKIFFKREYTSDHGDGSPDYIEQRVWKPAGFHIFIYIVLTLTVSPH